MFKLSCFHVNVQGNKAKKIAQPSTEAMVKALQVNKDSFNPSSSNSSLSKEQVHKQMNVTKNDITDKDSVEHIGRLEDLNNKSSTECYREVRRSNGLKKSQSLQSRLYQGTTEGDGEPGFLKSDSTISICRKYLDANPIDHDKTNPDFEFQVISSLGNNGSLFSIGDPTPSEKDAREISETRLSGDFAGDSAEQISDPSTPSLMKSRSLPNIKGSTPEKYAFKHVSSMSRSSDDLHALGMRKTDVFVNESDDQIRDAQEKENNVEKTEDSHMERYFDDGFDSSIDCLSEFPNKDFKVKRIEDWVIGLPDCGQPLEEINELPEYDDPIVDVNTINGVPVAAVDHKITPGMETAKRYISSLSANATAAQLVNHGLVVIPFLSAFVSLKVLNLAGNAIVRITAGALPRGLHTLNLSKNNISTIEGLRELTRLRVLDLSYNRILRIGHGLASCSSLKEMYLTGNKIGEVEGLHRLLKLSVLDLRFNKISTTKCLGQLAANYNSLQAINLDGNPCQKNVGDEQLKKYLQGLLPHLVYYNRQAMKASSLKDGTDRLVRLGMNSQQFDRSLRVDRKSTRKSSHSVVAARRSSSSSLYALRGQTVDSPKLSKCKQGQLPPISTKASTQSRYHFDSPSKVPNMTSRHSMRKSRSEGFLGAL